MNRTMAVLALAILTAFLGILILHVPRLDLIAVVAVTLILAAWDLYTTFRRPRP